MTACPRAHPFSLNGSLRLTHHEPLNRLLEGTVEHTFALARLGRMYQALPPTIDCDHFLQQTLDAFHIRVHCPEEALQRIPASGPLVVVANHPFGALEGVILAQQLRRVRPDVKILANYFLERIPELRELFISVDPFGGEGAAGRNLRPLKQALAHLQQGGLLVIFPAGEVSRRRLDGATIDPPWHNTVARLVRRTAAPVVPVYFPGGNSLLFHLAGLLHPRLRTALLPRELLNKRNRTITPRIGAAIPFAKLKPLDDDVMTAQLRLRCYALSAHTKRAPEQVSGGRPQDEISTEVAASLLSAEVAALPQEQQLDQSGDLQVWYAKADQIPWLLQEIGRLREITFRAAGEGTGRSRDIDLYDAYYLHLFIWDRGSNQLVGAYRLGLADEIVRHFGVKGLYTHSLFRYRAHLLQQIAPAIELGRSFVRPEYQRSYSPLLLLWKGIGQFVARHPHYRTLFGPVSISGDYATQSQQLLVQFLRANNYLPQLARYVRPRRPFRAPWRPGWLHGQAAPADLEQLSELVSAMEEDQKGVPVLLRQYLKLGGHILGFNVDQAFNNALDGLIMVDLRQTDAKVLARYMGREQAEQFRALHGMEYSS